MKKSIATVIAAGLLGSAQAAVILGDDPLWGASSVIRDLDNGRDFLRLDFTTPYGTYAAVSEELGAGGAFDGWGIAALADMVALGLSADITHGSDDPANVARAEALRDMFCFNCVNLSTTHEVARGLILETLSPTPSHLPPGTELHLAFTMGRRFNVSPEEVDYRVSGYAGVDWGGEEVFLVRDTAAVPEPSTLGCLGLGLGMLAFVRARGRRKPAPDRHVTGD